MANFFVRCFNQINKNIKDMQDGTHAEVIAEQTLILQAPKVVAVGATSTQSAAVGANTTRIVLSTTTDCWIAIGSNPTAAANTAGSFFLSAGSQSYPIVATPSTTKVAVIQNASSGYLSVIESA